MAPFGTFDAHLRGLLNPWDNYAYAYSKRMHTVRTLQRK